MQCVVLVLLVCLGCASVPSAVLDDSSAGQLASMTWLAGTWSGASPQGTWIAQYLTPDGGMILGASKGLLEGDRVFYEFEIFFVENDQVVVRPRPRGEGSVVFELAYLDREGQRARF